MVLAGLNTAPLVNMALSLLTLLIVFAILIGIYILLYIGVYKEQFIKWRYPGRAIIIDRRTGNTILKSKMRADMTKKAGEAKYISTFSTIHYLKAQPCPTAFSFSYHGKPFGIVERVGFDVGRWVNIVKRNGKYYFRSQPVSEGLLPVLKELDNEYLKKHLKPPWWKNENVLILLAFGGLLVVFLTFVLAAPKGNELVQHTTMIENFARRLVMKP